MRRRTKMMTKKLAKNVDERMTVWQKMQLTPLLLTARFQRSMLTTQDYLNIDYARCLILLIAIIIM